MTDDEITAIRDAHLPSQGEAFDCIAFARAVIAARQSADALDAARYRWLKDIANTEQIGVGESSDDFRWLYGDEADAAIDAAMARESAESGGAR